MGVRNQKREILRRLDSKTLDAKFLTEIEHGLNCSPFEAEAVLEVVKEVYFPFVDEHCVKAPPGKITLVAVSADEPAGKPVAECEKQTVCLTLHRGSQDDQIVQEQEPAGFRQARVPEIWQEALSQGVLLTREDLAYRVFFVSPRTITRDLQVLRAITPDVVIPLRSTVQDIGPVLTHRTKIVRLALEGKTMTEICQIMHHSPRAISNYLSTFTRRVQLARKEMQAGQIAFLLRLGTCSGGEKETKGGPSMSNQSDRLRAGIRSQLQKTLENALSRRIAKEFPRIGGPRICQLCAEMILEVVGNHVRPKETVRHGQMVWTAVSKKHRPGRCQPIAETDLVSVVLDVSTPEDIHAKIERVSDPQRKLQRALRLCHQAHEQGGLLTCFDLSEIMSLSDSYISILLANYERENKTIIPRRGTLQDAGGGLSHKWIICYKRYVEGKSPDLIARETYHSLTAADRYLGQFDRVRHCFQQGLSANETAQILNCSLWLVETYRQLDQEFEAKDG